MKSKRKKNKGNRKVVVKKKIRFGRVFLAFFIFFIIIIIGSYIYLKPLSNIIIENNQYLTDQEIIDMLDLSNHSSYLETTTKNLNKKIKKDTLLKKVTVNHHLFGEVVIKVEEKIPIYYDQEQKKTVLSTKEKVDKYYQVPLLRNYVPDTISDKMVEVLSKINKEIKEKISEIEYDPNDVDEERFLLIMADNNKVYVTLEKFLKINYYNDIMERVLVKYQNKKGTLYLDEGEYFVLEKS